jgi:hypothetical protein
MILKIASLFSVKSELGPFLVIPFEFMPYFCNMSVNIVFTPRSSHFAFPLCEKNVYFHSSALKWSIYSFHLTVRWLIKLKYTTTLIKYLL